MRRYKGYCLTLLTVVFLAAGVYFGGTAGCDNDNTNACGTPVAGGIRFAGGGMGGCGGPDTTAAASASTVSSTNPVDGETDVAINRTIAASFSEEMDPLTITTSTFLVTGPGSTPVSGTVDMDATNRIAIFTPDSDLAPDTTFTATITTGAQGLACNALGSDYVWNFTTGATADEADPTVSFTNPADDASTVCINKTIAVTFSEAMDPLTITTENFTVTGPGTTPVTGTVDYDLTTDTATFTPDSDLAPDTLFTATITTGVTDLAGNALAVDEVWTFTTSACTTPIPPPVAPLVDLGTAAPFGNLGGTAGTTNMGILTVINGDLGSTATVTSAVTGFHDSADIYTETGSNQGDVNGTIYTCTVSTTGPTSGGVNVASCATATQARLDAITAYNALAALPPGANPGGNLGGQTLAPGVYTAPAGSFLITGSDLTLDGQGDANAVFVFQMASTLTVGAPAAPRSVILIGGAQAKNVFWQVGSSATINAAGGGTMVGTILADQAVSFSTAGNVAIVTLEGRAAGLNASVTMTNTVVNVPAP